MEINKELYKKLKIACCKIEQYGYMLDCRYDNNAELYKRTENIGNKKIALYLCKKYDRPLIHRVSFMFTAEPCSVNNGNKYYSIEESREIVKYWTKILDMCEYLNSLNIEGNIDEINNIVKLINKRKRKEV